MRILSAWFPWENTEINAFYGAHCCLIYFTNVYWMSSVYKVWPWCQGRSGQGTYKCLSGLGSYRLSSSLSSHTVLFTCCFPGSQNIVEGFFPPNLPVHIMFFPAFLGFELVNSLLSYYLLSRQQWNSIGVSKYFQSLPLKRILFFLIGKTNI